jgi:hypothetical protein
MSVEAKTLAETLQTQADVKRLTREQLMEIAGDDSIPKDVRRRWIMWWFAADKEEVRAAWEQTMEKLGVPKDLQPVGAKRLQEMFLAAGMKPEDNELSRAIIAMREEE